MIELDFKFLKIGIKLINPNPKDIRLELHHQEKSNRLEFFLDNEGEPSNSCIKCFCETNDYKWKYLNDILDHCKQFTKMDIGKVSR